MTPQQIEALKLALEALETYKGFIDDAHIIEGQWHWIDGLDNVQTAIKEALAEHAMRETQRLGQEIEQKIGCVNHDCDKCKERKPLTDKQIQKIWDVASGAIPGWSRHIAYARAIEAAHGIKENA